MAIKRAIESKKMIEKRFKQFMQKGFTLLELLIVVVLVGIVSALAVIGYRAVYTGAKNKVQTVRLSEYVEAQNRFRTILGRRRFATYKELCQAGLLNETVARNDSSCGASGQTPIDGYVIEPGTETTNFLKNNFFAVLKFKSRPAGETLPIYCIGDDGVLRQSKEGRLDTCTISSDPVNLR